MKIYEENSKAQNPFGLVRQCDENSHYACKYLIEKYEVLDEKQESLNDVANW